MPHKILENVWLGDANDSKQTYLYDVIVNCTKEVKFSEGGYYIPFRIPIDDIGEEAQFKILRMMLPNLCSKMYEWEKGKKRVLVHCYAGQQRSCCVLACYMLWRYDMDVQSSMAYIKDKRSVAFLGGSNFIKFIERWFRECKESKRKHVQIS